MLALSLDSEKRNDAKQRLGQRGELATSQYNIEFSDNFKRFQNYGVKRADVKKTLTSPDLFQHLLREQDVDADQAALSVYVKKKKIRQHESVLLVQAKRNGDTLLVVAAWRFFTKALVEPQPENASEYLEQFANYFGLEFSVADSLPKKFFRYEAYPMLSKHTQKILDIKNSENVSFDAFSLMRVSPLGVVEVSLAYVVNKNKYVQHLRNHGIRVIE